MYCERISESGQPFQDLNGSKCYCIENDDDDDF
jgi:hypothetical protein